MLVASRRLTAMQRSQIAHGMNMGAAFYERVNEQQAYADVHERAGLMFGLESELLRKYVHIDDVVNALEQDSSMGALAMSWPGTHGLRLVAARIRAGSFVLGAPLEAPRAPVGSRRR